MAAHSRVGTFSIPNRPDSSRSGLAVLLGGVDDAVELSGRIKTEDLPPNCSKIAVKKGKEKRLGYELEMQDEPEVVVCGACDAKTYFLALAPRFCPHCGTPLEGGDQVEEPAK